MYVSCQGCEYHGYSSDITRTWPVSGRFSQSQRDLYEAVLSVQTELIRMCTTLPSLDSLFHAMCSLLGLRLQELGVLSSRSTQDELSRVSTLLSHKCGFLGLSHEAFNKFSAIGACYFHFKCITVLKIIPQMHIKGSYIPKSKPRQPVFSRNLVIFVAVLWCMCVSVYVWWNLNKFFPVFSKGTGIVHKIILCF